MSEKKRCPRCGQDIEGEFCPNCDSHYDNTGMIRIHPIKRDTSPTLSIEDAVEQKMTVEDVLNQTPAIQQTDSRCDVLSQDEEIAACFHIVDAIPITSLDEDDEERLPFVFKLLYQKKQPAEKNEPSSPVIQKPESLKTTRQWPLKYKQLFILGVVLMVIGILFGFGIHYYQTVLQPQQAITAQAKVITTAIDKHYVDHNAKKGYMDTPLTQTEQRQLEKRIDTLKSKDKAAANKAEQQLNQLQKVQSLTTQLNDLYTSKKIDKSHVLNPALKENVSIQLVAIKHPSTAFDKTYNACLKDAKAQQKKMQQATDAMNTIYYDGQVADGVTKAQFEKAKSLVDAVKNTEFQKKYAEPLAQVENKVNK